MSNWDRVGVCVLATLVALILLTVALIMHLDLQDYKHSTFELMESQLPASDRTVIHIHGTAYLEVEKGWFELEQTSGKVEVVCGERSKEE